MNFDDTSEEAAFRAQVRHWLDGNATLRRTRDQRFGQGLDQSDYIAAAKVWQAKKAAAGYAAITWPLEQGGMGGTAAQQVVFQQEEARYLVPAGIFDVSLGMSVPTVNMWATPAQRDRYIARGLSGADIWCQLFSEPSAGSDIGNIRTRAMRDGDEWSVSGQKVWTSGAHFSDYGILLARTDWDAPKTKGLTMFVLDMKAVGVEVRPIHQASGEYHFNEVFLDNVRIPDSDRIGTVNKGWQVMLSTLMQERLSVGGSFPTDIHDRLIALARNTTWGERPAIEDARVRGRIADAYLDQFGVELIIRRALSAISKGSAPGPELALVKLVGAKAMLDLGGLALEVGGADALGGPEDLGGDWRWPQPMWLSAPGARLAGGTDEILRNTIAERVLGLPSEIRQDRDKPFRELEA
jgi:alkylation response protein AidB-like acyl-CoA dehydrogenase